MNILSGSTPQHSRPFSAPLLTLASLFVLSCFASGCRGGDTTGEKPVESRTTAHTHAVKGETCFICDASKRVPKRMWCKEHGRYEDRCWECHPELREEGRAYCEEHGLYEDECHLCDASRAKGKPKATQGKVDELFCNEHQVPERQCGICQPQLAKTLPVGESLKIRLASDRSAKLAGVSIGRPDRVDASVSIPLLGEIRFNGNRLAQITPLAGGVLSKIDVDVGSTVKAGEVLAVVSARGAATAKADYLSARAELRKWQAAAERQRRLFEDRVGSRGEMEAAEASYRRALVSTRLASAQLKNLGFTEAEIKGIRDSRSELPLRAPFRGSVVKRTAVLGEAVSTTKGLFEIADLSEMWVEIAVPEEHASRIAVGTRLQVTAKSLPGLTLTGTTTWVSPIVDQRTRVVRARGSVPNKEGVLRHSMFVNVTANVETHPDSMQLPASALHRVDDLPFVFVQESSDLFAARRVEIGGRLSADRILVRQGIRAEDSVVMTGGFAIKSALLAARLGAGCADE